MFVCTMGFGTFIKLRVVNKRNTRQLKNSPVLVPSYRRIRARQLKVWNFKAGGTRPSRYLLGL
jgi:hypothetical protein